MRSSRLMMMNREKQMAKDFDDCKHQNKPYFFKVILSPHFQNLNLRIPKDFVKKYGRHFSNEIYLNVPNSEQPWKIELHKDDHNMFLKGKFWHDLMSFYKISYGSFLLFRFDGGSPSQFHVLIFDKSCTEINYPLRNSCDQKKKRNSDCLHRTKKVVKAETADDDDEEEEEDDEDEDEDEDDNEDGDEDEDGDDDDEEEDEDNKSKSIINLDSSDSDVECSTYKSKGVVLSPQTRQKLIKKKLDALKSPYPHFKVVLHRTHVSDRYYLGVPISHAKIHFPSNSKEIKLIGPKEKSYHVRFYMGKTTAQFSSGWKDFVTDYHLKIGDACMFELINSHSPLYKVSIVKL